MLGKISSSFVLITVFNTICFIDWLIRNRKYFEIIIFFIQNNKLENYTDTHQSFPTSHNPLSCFTKWPHLPRNVSIYSLKKKEYHNFLIGLVCCKHALVCNLLVLSIFRDKWLTNTRFNRFGILGFACNEWYI